MSEFSTIEDRQPDSLETPSLKPEKRQMSQRARVMFFVRSFLLIYLILGIVIASPLYSVLVLRAEGPNGPAASLWGLDKIMNARREEYYFPTAHGQKLHGWLFCTPGSDRVVVVHHGIEGNILHRLFIAKHCIQAGASVFLYDYRGYGKSEGSVAVENLPEDGQSAYNFVRKTLNFKHIINYGESLGTAVAMQVSKDNPCDGTIIQSGLCSLPAAIKDGLPFMHAYPDLIFPKPHFSNIDMVKDVRTPILVVHGMQDKRVPYRHGEAIFARANEPKKLVLFATCGHHDMGIDDKLVEFDKSLQDFMAMLYDRPAPPAVTAESLNH